MTKLEEQPVNAQLSEALDKCVEVACTYGVSQRELARRLAEKMAAVQANKVVTNSNQSRVKLYNSIAGP